ncbi:MULTISPECIES: alpha/beta hydrolase [Nostocales]|uniref:Alpha/beta hydrolase n=2 Tax=Nostocales TaxID=1161 RepID=A0ABW8WZ40_9CYAN|nr:alpha/beta hydrolase [Tolypothrix bouteillei]
MLLSSTLASSGQDPQKVRKYLTEPVKVNLLILDKILNSRVGNAVLDQISQVIYTPSSKANRQALRSALILSASNDKKITLIEIIQNYPTSEVEVDGDKLGTACASRSPCTCPSSTSNFTGKSPRFSQVLTGKPSVLTSYQIAMNKKLIYECY